MYKRILQFLLLFFTPTCAVHAQVDLAAGSTDFATSNVHMTIPVFSKPGFDLRLDFNSHIVIGNNLNGSRGIQFIPYASLQANSGIEAEVSPQVQSTVSLGCNAQPQTTYSDSVIVFSDGSSHPMPNTFQWKTGSGAGCNTVPQSGLTTTDGTDITVITTSTPWVAIDKSGTSYTLESPLYGFPTPRYKRTDANGNITKETVSNGVYTYTDIYGVGVVTLKINQGVGGTPGDDYAYVDGSGTTQHVTVNYTQYTMGSDFGCSGIGEVTALANNLSGYVPTSINMPDGSYYGLGYEQNWAVGKSAQRTGRVETITRPGGSSVQYFYLTSTGGSHGIDCNSGVTPKMNVVDFDGNTEVVTYTAANNLDSATNNFAVTVTNTVDNTTTTTHYSGANVDVQVGYTGNPALFVTETTVAQGSTQLGNTYMCYNNLLSPPTSCVAPATSPAYPITELDTYSNHDGMAATLTNRTKTLYDGNGDVTSSTVYDWGTWGSPSPLSSTVTAYGSGSSCTPIGSYIVDEPCTVQVTDGAPTPTVYRSEIFTYNTHGNLTASSKAMKSGVNQTLSLARNGNGTLASVTNTSQTPNYVMAAYTYGTGSCNGFMPTKVDYSGAVSTAGNAQATWDCNGGVPITVTDQNGNVTTFAYNDVYYRLKSVTHPDNPASDIDTITYNGGNTFPWSVVSVTPVTASTSITATSILNGYGKTTQLQVTDPNNPTTGLRYQDFTYNGLGQLITKSNPYFSTTEYTYGNYQYSYDALGRVYLVTLPDSTTANPDVINTTFTGRDTRVYGLATLNNYSEADGAGRTTHTCDGIGSGSQANGDTTMACGLADVSVSGFQNHFLYNPAGDLTSVTRKGGPVGTGHSETKSYSVDLAGRVYSQTLPESGVDSWTFDTPLVGQLSTHTDARNITTTVAVDNLFRTTGLTFSDSTPPVQYYYDTITPPRPNQVGRLAWTQTSVGSTLQTFSAFSYDTWGNVSSAESCSPLNCNSLPWSPSNLAYTYDFASNLTSLTDTDAQNTLTYGRNSIGELTYIQPSYTGSGGDDVPPYLFGVGTTPTYDALGNITQYYDAGGINNQFVYDKMGRLLDYEVASGEIYYWNGGYNFDGNVINTNDAYNGLWTDTYDAPGRLQTANCAAGSCLNGWGAFQWTYDEFGNRWAQQVTRGSGPQPTYSFDTHNHIISGVTYDAAGNMTNDGNDTYTFDALGRMSSLYNSSSLATSGFVYDALGNRVEVTGNGPVAFVFSGSKPLHSNGLSFTGKNMQIEPLGQYAGAPGSGQMKFYLHYRDNVGSMREESKYDMTVGTIPKASWVTLPFGDGLTEVGGGDTNNSDSWLFGGMFQDDTWGTASINHTPARENSTTQGRWLSVDPAHSGWNGYVYANNNPMTESDPSGLLAGCANLFCGGGWNSQYQGETTGNAQTIDKVPVTFGPASETHPPGSTVLNLDGSVGTTISGGVSGPAGVASGSGDDGRYFQGISSGNGGFGFGPAGGELTLEAQNNRIVVIYDSKASKGTLYVVGGSGTDQEILLQGGVVVGGDGHVTPTGKFHAGSWEIDHTSKLYGALADKKWSKSFLGLNAFGPYQLHIKELESRGIYIHGTMGPGWSPTTAVSGLAVSQTSHGCVRMCNRDDIALHNLLPHPEGTPITISTNPKDAPEQ
jgi:RHS repeat-associated protein